jgi:hypothetical protein
MGERTTTERLLFGLPNDLARAVIQLARPIRKRWKRELSTPAVRDRTIRMVWVAGDCLPCQSNTSKLRVQ